ncbi:MAG: class I SAM-dependent methyltransferase [Bacteriovoracaceae bacterium]|nr:class I SAM-dependent methyltransferase [Bacteriovoracaceae bacterium]
MSILKKHHQRSMDTIFTNICDVIEKYDIKSICDYGCGNGDFLIKLQKKFPVLTNCTGIDCWSFHGDDHTIPKNQGMLRFEDNSLDGFKKFIKENSFDLVISTFALHHFKYPVKELKCIESLTKSGGHIFISDMLTKYEDDYLTTNIMWLHGETYLKLINKHHGTPYTLDEMRDLMKIIDGELVDDSKMPIVFSKEEEIEFSNYFIKSSKESMDEMENNSKKHQIVRDLFILQKKFHIDLLQKKRRKINDLVKLIVKKH